MPISEVTNEDCMLMMGRYPDKFFDLAIVDPPYGIGFDGQKFSTSNHGGRKAYEFKGWDNNCPDQALKDYFANRFENDLSAKKKWLLLLILLYSLYR